MTLVMECFAELMIFHRNVVLLLFVSLDYERTTVSSLHNIYVLSEEVRLQVETG